ncbi:MAG: protein-L-isoaspartate O-methyltransferase [Rhodospirillaceae bacterium]|nr:protein-L-isoaspartate O-methyltransferase [Rhodospirillaceae bacterium]
MIDHAVARQNMVSGQIRTNRVTDERLIEAMEEIPRELFVPRAKRGVAYVDEDVEIASGRYLMEPMVLARLVQEAEIRASDMVLDVGCGTGYASAVMARLAGTVIALDTDEALVSEAEQALSAVGADNAIVVTGALADGFAEQAPYDVILVGGAVDHLPQALADQLAEAGRIVGVVREPGRVGQATLWARHRGALSSRSLFEASLPPLPGIVRPAQFEF